jgi:hypothetical protein
MASDPSIYNLVGQGVTPVMNPAEIAARKNALAIQSQELQKNALALDQMQRQITDQANLRSAMQNYYGDRTGTAPAASSQLFDTAPAAPAPLTVAPGAAPSSSAGAPAGGGLSLVQPGPSSVDSAPSAAAPAAPPAPAAAPAAAPVVPQRPPMPTMADLIRRNVAPSDASALIQQFQAINEKNATIQKTLAEADEKQTQVAGLIKDQSGMAARAIIKSGYNPAVMQYQLDSFALHGQKYAAMVQGIKQQLAANPADAPRIFNSIADASTDQVKSSAEETNAQTAATELRLNTPSITTNANGLTPSQQSEHDLRKQEIDKLNTPAELAFIASRPGPDQATAKAALELIKQNNIAERQASQPVISLTPGAQSMLADNYTQTGNIPSIPRGQGGAIVAGVLNQAAATNPAANLGLNRADYKANSQSLAALQKQRDALVTFEKGARANLDNFVTLAQKLPDTGVPWLNQPLRNLNDKALGNDWAPAVAAARQIAVNEIAKVTSNPTLSGALSDSARHEVAEYNPANATYKQTLNVAKVLRQDMDNRRLFLEQGISEIRGRLGAGGGLAAPQNVPPPGGSFNGQKVISVTRIE